MRKEKCTEIKKKIFTTAVSPDSSALSIASHSFSTNESYFCKTETQVRTHYTVLWLSLHHFPLFVYHLLLSQFLSGKIEK